jgi:hypothetical protein
MRQPWIDFGAPGVSRVSPGLPACGVLSEICDERQGRFLEERIARELLVETGDLVEVYQWN